MIGSLTEDEIRAVLLRNVVGRIGCGDGRKTYVVPVNYVFDGRFIVAHSLEGLKIRMMRKNPAVCFEVDEMQDYNNWRSVITWGIFQELKEERERYEAMKLLTQKMIHMKVSRDAISRMISLREMRGVDSGSDKPVIYRIVIKEMSGRYEE